MCVFASVSAPCCPCMPVWCWCEWGVWAWALLCLWSCVLLSASGCVECLCLPHQCRVSASPVSSVCLTCVECRVSSVCRMCRVSVSASPVSASPVSATSVCVSLLSALPCPLTQRVPVSLCLSRALSLTLCTHARVHGILFCMRLCVGGWARGWVCWTCGLERTWVFSTCGQTGDRLETDWRQTDTQMACARHVHEVTDSHTHTQTAQTDIGEPVRAAEKPTKAVDPTPGRAAGEAHTNGQDFRLPKGLCTAYSARELNPSPKLN